MLRYAACVSIVGQKKIVGRFGIDKCILCMSGRCYYHKRGSSQQTYFMSTRKLLRSVEHSCNTQAACLIRHGRIHGSTALAGCIELSQFGSTTGLPSHSYQ